MRIFRTRESSPSSIPTEQAMTSLEVPRIRRQFCSVSLILMTPCRSEWGNCSILQIVAITASSNALLVAITPLSGFSESILPTFTNSSTVPLTSLSRGLSSNFTPPCATDELINVHNYGNIDMWCVRNFQKGPAFFHYGVWTKMERYPVAFIRPDLVQ